MTQLFQLLFLHMETLLEFPSIVGIEVGVAYSANESMETDFEGITNILQILGWRMANS